MAYFQHNKPEPEHERLFIEPIVDEDDDWMDDPEPDLLPDDLDERRRSRLVVARGVIDFLGVAVGSVLILAFIAIIISLLNWLLSDASQFIDLWRGSL